MSHIVPRSFLLDGFNYDAPYPWGSNYVRPNGFFFLETSFASAFTAAAAILEITHFRRWHIVALMIAATFLSSGATGITMLLVALPFLFARETPRVAWTVIGVGIVAIAVGFAAGIELPIFSRLEELDESQSSGSGRVSVPAAQLLSLLTDPTFLFSGTGAGTTPRIFGDAWPIVKTTTEYGVTTTFAFALLNLAALAGRFNLPTKVAVAVIFHFTGGYLLNPIMVEFFVLVCTILVPAPAETSPQGFLLRAPGGSQPHSGQLFRIEDGITAMRLLWIGKQPTDGWAGDEVFDRKAIAACEQLGHSVHCHYPVRVSRARDVANMVSGIPHARTWYASAKNAACIRQMAGRYDATISSWEPFDAITRGLQRPAVLVLHNITSRSLPALYPGNSIVRMAAMRARSWERKSYRRRNFASIGALSLRDRDYLVGIEDRPNVFLVPPGMPPVTETAPQITLLKEIVITGTYEWTPKLRDLLKFADEFTDLPERYVIRANGLPPQAAKKLLPQPVPTAQENRTAVRFGLISDRFEAGHKLKTMAYIADNQIVLSFADIAFDFAHIPDADFFIRKISAAAEIRGHMDAVAALSPSALRERLVRFQDACAAYFSWRRVAETLLDAAVEARAYCDA